MGRGRRWAAAVNRSVRHAIAAVLSAGPAASVLLKRLIGGRARLTWTVLILACTVAAPIIHAALATLKTEKLFEMERVWLAGSPLLLLASACPAAARRRFAGGVVVIGAFLAELLPQLSESYRRPGPGLIVFGAIVAGCALLGARFERPLVRRAVSRMALFANLTIIVTAVAVLFDAESIQFLLLWPGVVLFWVLAAGGISRLHRFITGLLVFGYVFLPTLTVVLGVFSISAFFAGVAYFCVLIVAVAYVDVAERLLAPIGMLTATLLVATMTFYQRPPPGSEPRLLPIPVNPHPAVAAYIEGTGPDTSQPNYIDLLRIDVQRGYCNDLSAHLVFSWRPAPKHKGPSPRVAIVTNAPGITKPAEASPPKWLDAYTSGEDQDAWEDLSDLPGGLGLVRALASPDGTETAVKLPKVKWMTPAGIGTCYILVPTVIGPDAMETWKEGRSRLVSSKPQAGLTRFGPVESAQVLVHSVGGGLSVASGPGPDTASGNELTWACDASKYLRYTAPDVSGCVGAVVLVTQPWRRNFEQVMLLVIGALFSVIVELSIRAVDRW